MRVEPSTEADTEAVARLLQICNEQEGLELPIEPGSDGVLYRVDGDVVGFAGLQSDQTVESTGMVHPEHRRRGIGSALLEAVRAWCRQRGVKRCFIVLDEASPSGRGFALASGARYHISEYRMVLDPASFVRQDEWVPALELRQVDAADVGLFSSLVARAFGDPEEAVRRWLEDDMRSPNRRFWIAYLDDGPVGTVRVIGSETSVYVTSLGVVPERQKGGLGRQILARTVAALQDEDWDEILIEVETENANALGLYRSLGFRETRTYGFYEIPL